MPIKEYQCRQCGNNFKTVLFQGDEEKNPACPNCRSLDLERPNGSTSIFNGISNFSALAKDSN
jgi:putative FmdB family regulatory protein